MIPVDMLRGYVEYRVEKDETVSPIHGIHDGQSNDISGK